VKRKRSIPIKDDPVVAEVRRWRAKLWKQGGGTLKGVMEMLRASQDAREAAGDAVVIRKKNSARSADRKKRRAA
jgi:hypothetical protein